MYLSQLKDKIFIGIIGGIGGILASAATSIPIYNKYISHDNRHDEMINKIAEFDKRLTKIEDGFGLSYLKENYTFGVIYKL
jgi:hypothetical protein